MTREYQGFWRVLNGPQELGRGPVFWCLFAFVALGLLAYPFVGSVFALSNLANFCLYVPMGLGLALLWGYNGVLSFGQSAFFSIAGYVYGIIGGNLLDMPGGTLLAAVVAIVASAANSRGIRILCVLRSSERIGSFRCCLLVLSLILETFMAQTAGYQWRVGSVLLGGYNGMTNIPSLQIGSAIFGGASIAFYYLVVSAMLITYLGLRLLVNSHYGHVVAGIRDDVERTRMLGYNVNLIQIQVFVLAAALAGLSGILYVSWGNYINPSSMGLLPRPCP